MSEERRAGVLSQEEMSALRSVVTSEGQVPQPASLTSEDRKGRRKLKTIARLVPDMLAALRAFFARELRLALPMAAQEFEFGGKPAIDQAADKWLMALKVKKERGEPVLVVGFTPQLGYQLIELAYGAPLTQARPTPERRRLTEVEKQTLYPFLCEVVQILCGAIFPGAPLSKDYEIHEVSTPVTHAMSSDTGLISAVDFELGGRPMQIGYALLPAALDLIGETDQQDPVIAQRNLRASLCEVDVEMVANLGGTRIAVQQLASLAVGDLLWLDHVQTDPVALFVAGCPKFLAQPMQRSGAVGVQIVARI